ncbi:MAG TPA: tRNA lysidine(34) synthetase TilS [Rhizomicrobium sp.]|nr:tRNA lysidine(34) synthetase TilS [Rhizomicrobium sp.]
MDSVLHAGASWPGAVAVSGGADSVALMLLSASWAKAKRIASPVILTVDHGLRTGSRKDALSVVRAAKKLGLKAHILSWKGTKPRADIEAAAREARYRLMGEWCAAQGVCSLYVAHSLDDQAETFLLRLARGSGVDGLSAMQRVSHYPLQGFDRISVARPLLGFGRADLRAFVSACRQNWVEDPMNLDPRFARSRLRIAWPALTQAGLSASRIADAARHLRRARHALEWAADTLLAAGCRFEGGKALLDSGLLVAAPPEIGLRALASVLMTVSGLAYRPRFERLERLYGAITDGPLKAAATLHGCRIGPASKQLAVFGPGTLEIGRERSRRLCA